MCTASLTFDVMLEAMAGHAHKDNERPHRDERI